jgi:hypothetical protein
MSNKLESSKIHRYLPTIFAVKAVNVGTDLFSTYALSQESIFVNGLRYVGTFIQNV